MITGFTGIEAQYSIKTETNEHVQCVTQIAWLLEGSVGFLGCAGLAVVASDVSSSPLQPRGNHFYSPCLIKMSHPL